MSNRIQLIKKAGPKYHFNPAMIQLEGPRSYFRLTLRTLLILFPDASVTVMVMTFLPFFSVALNVQAVVPLALSNLPLFTR